MASNLIENFLFQQGPGTVTLKKTLDAQSARQRAHAQNIANAETPGYQRVTVDFESQLRELVQKDGTAFGKSTTEAIAEMKPQLRQEALDPDRPGINGVDIDVEMAEMAETQLRYMAALELLKRRYAGLKSAIRGQP